MVLCVVVTVYAEGKHKTLYLGALPLDIFPFLHHSLNHELHFHHVELSISVS